MKVLSLRSFARSQRKANERLTVKQLKCWLKQFPEDTKVYYDMNCIYGYVDLRVEVPATDNNDISTIATIEL